MVGIGKGDVSGRAEENGKVLWHCEVFRIKCALHCVADILFEHVFVFPTGETNEY